ncbi:MAG: hypothetical protein EA365_15640 [Gloeocapsa sp. DLM2.Bin57]|nr:MAG: hypothetical protein EA365_15640 [Gloeocapsa sp. DLM2.Bin57]
MEIGYNSRFFSLMLIGALSVSLWGFSSPKSFKAEDERPTNCRDIHNSEERVGVSVTRFNGKSIDISDLISHRVSRNDLIGSLRIHASRDTSAPARVIVDGETSAWYSPKFHREYGSDYQVYCFDDLYTRAGSDIEVQFKSGDAKPRNIVMFVRSK